MGILAIDPEQANRFEALRQGFQQPTFNWVGIVCLILLIALGALIVWLLIQGRREEQRETLDDPRSLFWDLVQAHGFSKSDGQLLERAAKLLEGIDADLLFVRPDLFDQASTALSKEDQQAGAELGTLGGRLFDDAEESAADHQPPAMAGMK